MYIMKGQPRTIDYPRIVTPLINS